jgi:hypothetical protein
MSYSDKLDRDIAARNAARGEGYVIDGSDPFSEIEAALDARELSMAMRKVVARKLLERVSDDGLSGGDLVRLMGMLNDRIDGKVMDKIEHSGNIGLSEILADVMGTSGGLPKREWIDAVDVDIESESVYAEPVLSSDVVLVGSDNVAKSKATLKGAAFKPKRSK